MKPFKGSHLLIALGLVFTGLTSFGQATGFSLPLNAPSWWGVPGTLPDGVTRNQYHSFITNPNENAAPDYTYNGFPASDVWSVIQGGSANALGVPIPSPNPFVHGDGTPTGDSVGLYVKEPTTLEKAMGNLYNKEYIKLFFVNVIWFSPAQQNILLSVSTVPGHEISALQTTYASTASPGWYSTWLTGVIRPQPDIEWFQFHFDRETWVDSVFVGTHCVVPEPTSIAGIGTALFGLVAFRFRRKK